MNREELMAQLEPMSGLRVRDIPHDARIKVAVAEKKDAMSFHVGGGKPITVSQDMVGRMLKFAGVPGSMAESLRPNTLGQAVTECLAHKRAYSLILDGSTMTDIVPYHERKAMPTERVVNLLERVVAEPNYHRLNMLQNHTVNLEIVGADEKPVSRGDLVRAGISLTFSPIGVVAPEVESYALRLACTNGMTSTLGIAQYKFNGNGDGDGDQNIWSWLRGSIKGAFKSFSHVVEGWQQLMGEGIPPENRAAVLEGLIRQAKLPHQVAEEVEARALANPPANAWDAMNLITWASSHRLDGMDVLHARRAMARYASDATHREVCPLCHAGHIRTRRPQTVITEHTEQPN